MLIKTLMPFLPKFFGMPQDNGQAELFLALEIIVERSFGNLCGVDDLLDAGTVIAASGEACKTDIKEADAD